MGLKVYGVELSDYEAQDVVKLFKRKKDAQKLIDIANSVYFISNGLSDIRMRHNPMTDCDIIDDMQSIMYDIGEILGTDTFFSRAYLREYEVE